MAEAIIGAQMRAHNPEPYARLADLFGRTAVSLTPLPMQRPQAVRLISHIPTRLRASMRSPTSRGMRRDDRAAPAGLIAERPSIRTAPRRGGPLAGIARS